jgi:hypothetical protein
MKELEKKPWETLLQNPERVWSKAEKTTDCWNWQGRITKYGYGQLSAGNVEVLAHRAAYFLANPEMDKSLCVMHSCDNPKCINPSHLSLGTHAENMADMKKKGRRKSVNTKERNGRSKLSMSAASSIRFMRDSGSHLKQIAEKFNVSISTIARVCNKENWV